MSAPERIVLPRSGLALTFGVPWSDIQDQIARSGEPTWSVEIVPGVSVMLVQYEDGPAWDAMFSESWERFSVLEPAIEWLDSRVLALRSALLKGAEETVAVALSAEDARGHWMCPVNESAEWCARTAVERERYLAAARAVVAALCGEDGK